MNIPKKIAEELWSEHPQVLEKLRFCTHINCLEDFDEDENIILIPYGSTNMDNNWSMEYSSDLPSVTVQLSKIERSEK